MKLHYLWQWIAHRVGWSICWFGAKLWWRLRYRDKDRIPGSGPVLLLSNHTSAFDPVWVAWAAWRPMHYMASAQLFRIKPLGMLIGSLGAFPKTKFAKDPEAMSRLFELYNDGRGIVIFPEGNRTWDGRLQEVRPGIGALIKQLDARVVTARIMTGHMHRPRWATHARNIPVLVEYDEPRTFPAEMSAEEITEVIRSSIYIDPDAVPLPEGSSGARLAMGLPQYLWACPACKAIESMKVQESVDADLISCEACSTTWRVDLACRMHPTGGGAPISVARAYESIAAHFGALPVADRARFEADGVALECPRANVGTIPRGERKPRPLAEGRLRLYEDRLELTGEGDEVLWSLQMDALKAVSVELGSVLQLRDGESLFQIDPGGESTIKWSRFIWPWRQKAFGRL